MSLRYLSVCSGIEAATVAWHPLGWSPVAFSEVDAFPSAVLKHHYPAVPNWGDMTKFQEWPDAAIDVLVGGTPCQSFSVAGLRTGLADPRGNLMLTYLAIAGRYRPRWLVWENVPGVLSSHGGRDFAALLGGLGELGYGFAYRVLDAQYFGVAQRRRRVFVVGHLGDWRRAAAVLFDRDSLSGHPAPTVTQGEGPTWWNGDAVSQTLDAVLYKGQMMPEKNRFPAIAVGDEWCSPASATTTATAPTATWITPSVAVLDRLRTTSLSTAKTTMGRSGRVGLRRVTPMECERLMGFPDHYTLVPYRGKSAPDTPRYKALGNSMAVPVMRWIGNRIAQVEAL